LLFSFYKIDPLEVDLNFRHFFFSRIAAVIRGFDPIRPEFFAALFH